MATPQVLSRKPNGVTSGAPHEPSKSKHKAPPEGEKIVVRRLPPGMTEVEFFSIIGDEWKTGSGKVDWTHYVPGKLTTDPYKVSRASRVYMHVKKRDDLMALQQAVEAVITAVRDQPKDTWSVGALFAPPAVEFSIYKKVPGGKKRSDARQGTIDQDPEFMAFLESLANPDAAKEPEPESTTEDGVKGEKVTTTPLVEYLKEKKANKAKEAAAAKSAKHSRQESKGKSSATGESKKKKGDKSDRPKETVKILTKKAAAEAAAEAAKAVANQIQAAQAGSTSKDLPKSRRAGIAAAARILQRDLGLSPGNAHRKARLEVAKAEAEAKAASTKDGSSPAAAEGTSSAKADDDATSPATSKGQAATSTSSGRSRNRRRGGGEDGKGKTEKTAEAPVSTPSPAKAPVILLKKKNDPAQMSGSASASAAAANPPTPAPAAAAAPTGPKGANSKQNSTSKKSSGPAAPTAGATRAFVKHVSSSQGVNESTLREALQAFGAVVSVEVDRRKGFAYAEFQDHEGLAKAMAASPVAVGQTTVQVIERKETATKKEKPPATKPTPPAASATTSQGETSSAAPAAAPSASGGEAKNGGEKRAARRRGGRGRGGEKDGGAKEGGGGGKAAEGGSGAPPASASAPVASAAG
ncbi:hypothetical protein GQ53DRAFT_789761 [Thozetella sp. PMI_491]|nr:hypothetical protein GQ53DRAFT_789761 [Thozetella sp. PMI_491]